MKVLVIGATGMIGRPIAQALSRAGHIVYGQTRSASKAKQLSAGEIIPVVGEVDNPKSWIGLVNEIDVVIEAIGGNETYILSAAIHRAVSEAASRRPAGAPKLSYIYTSGTWVHGEDRTTLVTDNTPITNPAKLVEWRPAVEQAILSDKTLNAIVIRPSLVYGFTGSLTGLLFGVAAQGKIVWPGTPGGRWAVVHADDLADLYVRTVGKAQLVGGLIFDASTSHSESVDQLLEKLVKVSGAQSPYEYKTPSNLFEEAISTTSLVRPTLARTILGWETRKAGLIDGLEVYYTAWKASQ